MGIIKSSITLHRRNGLFHVFLLLFHLLQFDLDSIWTFIFGVPASCGTVTSSIHNVCTEAAFLLLGMLRSMLNSVSIKNFARIWIFRIVQVCHVVKSQIRKVEVLLVSQQTQLWLRLIILGWKPSLSVGYSILLYFSVSVEKLVAMKLMLLFHKKAGLCVLLQLKQNRKAEG